MRPARLMFAALRVLARQEHLHRLEIRPRYSYSQGHLVSLHVRYHDNYVLEAFRTEDRPAKVLVYSPWSPRGREMKSSRQVSEFINYILVRYKEDRT